MICGTCQYLKFSNSKGTTIAYCIVSKVIGYPSIITKKIPEWCPGKEKRV